MFITFPDYHPKLKTTDLKTQVWCIVRKKWVMFTKEEWVRQSWLNYLIEVMKYPASLIAVEKEIHLGELKKRFDIVVFSNFLPWMIIECKEMNTSINEDTVKQVMIYNIRLKAPFMIISNGKNTIGVLIKEGRIYRLSSLPLIQ
ncbi:type I restriction enzyme HsdR N-terminal domain-containing protein [Sediminibacterium sp.]|uniref:type I restriction enzyme HsdR N-terminal domain-containing protein n=2 Tax=Sediminibacterium sp. TaxID=1917865 RepID=UPI000BD72652|nr:type I restriction enzyme HsdR N-terminal domain-containing protein [Sediminibacterium sp.]MDP3566157.1 type I restriction enzyme HsdR N-terminal domain-containing protein [Sediminibacterium sp.]OYY99942.1 MAG: hypothetical protein B7Y37_11825 [Sphingobacteriia bacterium 28-36-52]